MFVGTGATGDTVGGLFGADQLRAGGVGLRFRVSRKYPVNVSVDYALGRDSNALYFSIGEAF